MNEQESHELASVRNQIGKELSEDRSKLKARKYIQELLPVKWIMNTQIRKLENEIKEKEGWLQLLKTKITIKDETES